jgi:hypothetical protein
MQSGVTAESAQEPNAGAAPLANKAPDAKTDDATLAKAGQTQAAIQRKIIKHADLSLQTGDPDDGARRITAAAEALGGFVVTAEATQSGAARNVKITARVPAQKFDEFLVEIRKAGARILSEKQTSDDVTEDFIDLEARLRVQQETETRYLEFLKQAKNVEDALAVQERLSGVRTEIERLEGRKRFLESQTSLSTFNITLIADAVIIATPTGFWHDVKTSFSEGFGVATGIVLFLIRAFVALLPIFVLILLPLGLLARLLIKRYDKRAAPAAAQTAEKMSAPPEV